MNYFLGIDIGTTSTKAVAFSPAGEVLSNFSVGYNMQHPQPGWSEQDPGEIFQAVTKTINQVVDKLSPAMPSFVSFSAVLHSLILVDKQGTPMTPCIIWADNRAEAVAEHLRATPAGMKMYHSTGVPIHAMSPLCKLAWMKQHNPVLFKTAARFVGIKEYIFHKLFGEYLVDTAVASGTGLLNIKSLQWDREVLKFLDIKESYLSRVVSPKYFIPYPGDRTLLNLPRQTPVVIGGSDGALSNLGTGASGSHTMAVTIGTSGAARMIVKGARTDNLMRTFCYHVKDNEYIVGGASSNGAVVLQWLKEKMLETNESYQHFFEMGQNIPAGADGLLFLPYIFGERAPIWNSSAKGVYFGLDIQHSKAHLVRAAMEGVIYCIYSIGKLLTDQNPVTELHASGGFAKSKIWLQMLADVFNLKVFVSGTVESAAFGAVMIGAEALLFNGLTPKDEETVYTPVSNNHEIYKKGFGQFERIYQLLKDEMKPPVQD